MVYFDVDDADLLTLDVFEGSEYWRESVTVSLEADRNLVVETYVFIATKRLMRREWDTQAFRIAHFIDAYYPDI